MCSQPRGSEPPCTVALLRGWVLLGVRGTSPGCCGLKNQGQAELTCCWSARPCERSPPRLPRCQVAGVAAPLGRAASALHQGVWPNEQVGAEIQSLPTYSAVCSPRARCLEKRGRFFLPKAISQVCTNPKGHLFLVCTKVLYRPGRP